MTDEDMAGVCRMVTLWSVSDVPVVRLWLVEDDWIAVMAWLRRQGLLWMSGRRSLRFCGIPVTRAGVLARSRFVFADGGVVEWRCVVGDKGVED